MTTGNVSLSEYYLSENYTLAQAPPGVIPDLAHPKWHGDGVVIAASIGIPLMLIMASIRIYSKCYLTRRWVLDDYAFVTSLASAICLISLQVALVCEGRVYGYHAWEVRIRDLTKPVLVQSLILQVGTGPLTWLIKLSLFSLIYHTFHPLIYIRRLVFAGLFLSGLYYISSAIANAIPCGPRGGTDRLSYLAGLASTTCGNPSGIIQIFSITTGVVNLVVDLYLLVIPLRAISNLHFPKRRKMRVYFMFMTGAGACVMSVITLYYRTRGFSISDSSSWKHDTFYQNVSLWTVSTIEYSVGVIIPCMAPSARILSQATSYVSSRLTGFRRTKSMDDFAEEGRRMKPMARRLLPNGQPFSGTSPNTIDQMLDRIPTQALRNESHV